MGDLTASLAAFRQVVKTIFRGGTGRTNLDTRAEKGSDGTMWLPVLAITLAVAVSVPAPAHAKDAEPADPSQMVTLNADDLKFTSIPDMPDCATAAILRGNPRNGPAWVLLKLASGCRVPWHWHTANETMLVVSGRGTLAMKDGPPLRFAPGAYTVLPSRHMHQASCVRSCLFFNAADAAFDIHYVDENGEELSAKQALAAPASPKKTKKK